MLLANPSNEYPYFPENRWLDAAARCRPLKWYKYNCTSEKANIEFPRLHTVLNTKPALNTSHIASFKDIERCVAIQHDACLYHQTSATRMVDFMVIGGKVVGPSVHMKLRRESVVRRNHNLSEKWMSPLVPFSNFYYLCTNLNGLSCFRKRKVHASNISLANRPLSWSLLETLKVAFMQPQWNHKRAKNL